MNQWIKVVLGFFTQCSALSTMPSLLNYILLSLAVLNGCVKSIPVLTMDPSISPDDNATAEILDTKIINTLDKMTICGRFKTPYIPFIVHAKSFAKSYLHKRYVVTVHVRPEKLWEDIQGLYQILSRSAW